MRHPYPGKARNPLKEKITLIINMLQSPSLIDCHVTSRFPTTSRVVSKTPRSQAKNPCKTRAANVTRSRNHTSPKKVLPVLKEKNSHRPPYQPTAFDHDCHFAGPVRNRPRGVTSWQKQKDCVLGPGEPLDIRRQNRVQAFKRALLFGDFEV